MTKRQYDGGPAFPTDSDTGESPFAKCHPGMSLRDYFAAKAMQGALTRALPISDHEFSSLAANVYRVADAMLKARNA